MKIDCNRLLIYQLTVRNINDVQSFEGGDDMLNYRKIRSLRRMQNLSQTEFAVAVGYRSLYSVSRLERGLCDISLSRLEQIASVLGVLVSELILPPKNL